LAVILSLYPTLYARDMNLYLVLSSLTRRSVPLFATDIASVFVVIMDI